SFVGRKERSISRKSFGTPFMPSRQSMIKTGAQVTIRTKAMRNSTPLNQRTENRTQQTTGTAISSRTKGLLYRSNVSDAYISIANARPITKERSNATATRTNVIKTKSRRRLKTLDTIRPQPGMTYGGDTQDRPSQ